MTKQPYLIVDLETLGTKSNSVIMSIGAVLFTEKGIAKDKFYTNIDIKSCIDKGLNVDGDTLMWWMEQSDTARNSLNGNRLPLDKALQKLKNYVFKNAKTYDVHPVGNSARFDMGLLENAYNACGQEVFWKFWMERDYRTWKSLNGALPISRHNGCDSATHNALQDAIEQAEHAIELNKQFGGILL
ncbi:MAG: hypothetical protein CME43_01920 [Haliea sp.]|uniref:3'-5' exonuclease n=1 Tax=Haliea sp. TaxID=1932666 RepID=UPI000C40131A|nr:3'-5' exonuclease [Haliea sp.]MBM68176.1 hypothetical protein [Haliea sp.]MBM68219.1 hypothetical protein [Haliea sp.]|tara:strand:+ start:1076 stop:1633 length:558 start_codon:yes stop_codon:yes gene_type:complete